MTAGALDLKHPVPCSALIFLLKKIEQRRGRPQLERVPVIIIVRITEGQYALAQNNNASYR